MIQNLRRVPQKYTIIIIMGILITGCVTNESSSKGSINESESIGATKISLPTSSSNNLQSFQDILSYPNCNSFCWRGIEPGITERSEAEKILEEVYGNENIEIDDGLLSWISNDEDFSYSGNLIFLDDTVDEIVVEFDKEVLLINDLIKIIGDPTLVRVAIAFSSETNCASASIYYPDKSTEVWLYPQDQIVGVEKLQSISSFRILSLDFQKIGI